MSFKNIEWIWMNGELVRGRDAAVHVSAHTLHLGSGVFEAMRCYESKQGRAVFQLDAHLDRLFASARMHQIDIPYSKEELAEAVCETVLCNNLTTCYVRLLVYHGSGSLGVMPQNCPVDVAIVCWPLGAYLGAGALENGVRVTVSPWTKFHSSMMPTTAKACGQYLNSMLAMREAVSRGFDEALLLDVHGNIAEGAGENIFLVKDGRLRTNDEQSSILMGITRNTVIQIAEELGYSVDVGLMKLDDLWNADEAFFTGTAVEITPIREVDGTIIGDGRRGPITAEIQREFFDVTSGKTTGKNSDHTRWLHPVEVQYASLWGV
jgi:branched-chain amino acid aminotransferase